MEGPPHTGRDQVVLSHYRISHSWLTNVFSLKGEAPPECIACQSALTVGHILLDCVNFRALHQQFYTANGMPDFFRIGKQENILAFLRAAVPPYIIVSRIRDNIFYFYLELYLPEPHIILL